MASPSSVLGVYVDETITNQLSAVPGDAARVEAAGYDAAWTAETNHDPFFPLVLAAEHTQRLHLGTGIAVAFSRNPMSMAQLSWDLQAYSGGRFLLGLGSQIKPHIERRFSMPWSHPAPRMREFITAMRAIWACWQDGTKLSFDGEYYRHTLMAPFFDPGPIEVPPPKVFLAAVGAAMTRVAADVADGMLVHPFSTERYLREVTLPTVEAGLAERQVPRGDFQLSWPLFVVTGTNEEEWRLLDSVIRKQIAFYGSTPAYRPVLELHGWEDLHTELNGLSKQGSWEEMGNLIDDDILAAFAVVGEPDDLPRLIRQRTDGIVNRINFYVPPPLGEERLAGLITELQGR